MDRILGQPHAIAQLLAAVASSRVHHAWIFHGPAGVGKCTTALAFARLLLCHDRQSDLAGQPVPCDACASCRLLASPEGAHPDLHVVTKELARFHADSSIRKLKLTNIPVDVVRDFLLEPVYRAAQLSHGKVFIVDQAELLQGASQNAILKTLEEPPAGTYLVLVTSSEDSLLPTIRSRCQRVAFVPLRDEAVSQWLQRQAPDLDAATRTWLVEFAGGSIGRAALAMQWGLRDWWVMLEQAWADMGRGRYPAELGDAISGAIDGFAKAWVEQHENASKEAANKMAAGLMLAMVGQMARRGLWQAAQQAKPGDPLHAEPLVQPWLQAIDAITVTEAALGQYVNLTLACHHLVWRLYRASSQR